jgi:molybdate transport system permease protein
MVGGNIPGVTETVSISIFDQVQSLNFAAANHMALVLLLFSFVTLSVTYAVNRRIWAVWPLHR